MSADNERVIISKQECMDYINYFKNKYGRTKDAISFRLVRTLNYCSNSLFPNSPFVMLPCTVFVSTIASKIDDGEINETDESYITFFRDKISSSTARVKKKIS